MGKFVTITTTAIALFGYPAVAQPMSQEQMVATMLTLQARVDALEIRARHDRSDAEAARAELRAIKGRPRQVVGVPRHVPASYSSAPAPAPLEITKSSFDGLYGALIGGYQFGTTKARENLYFNFGDDANVSAASGGNIGASFGYNATSGPLLVGGELRFRRLFDATKSTGYYQFYSGYPNYTYENVPLSARYSREYGGDLSMRVGFVFDENLIYARVGGGADSLKHFYFDPFIGGVLRAKHETIASPYALIGLGVERNFGPWFARIEGAFLDHFEIRPTSYGRDSYFTTEISSAIGYRF